MSASLQRFQCRSQHANLPTLRKAGRRVSDAWSAPAGSASGSAGSACGPGKDRSPVCFQLAAELPGLLAHLPGIYVKVTVAWPTVRAGRPSYAAKLSCWLEH